MITEVILAALSVLMILSLWLLQLSRRSLAIAKSTRRTLDMFERDMAIEMKHSQDLRTLIVNAYRYAHDGDSHAACWVMYEGMRDSRAAYQEALDANPLDADEKAAA
jgi:hypothetical protein